MKAEGPRLGILLFCFALQGCDGFSTSSASSLSAFRPSPWYAAEGNSESEKSGIGSSGESVGVKKTSRSLLFDRFDTFGMGLKPKAEKAQEERSTATKKSDQIFFSLKTCAFFTLYMFYRAYRGFFVILPAVFKEVYRKLENAVDSPFVEDSSSIGPKGEEASLRTRVTVSVVASIVTLSYMINGASRVALKFIRTIIKTSSPSSSFSAAAEKMQENEKIFMKYSKKEENGGKINGDGLAP
mmetsp:Transcript_14251/g.21737  ORF Transcript_14251/g.21737 Transcript_14251/m.21737 type:complete len:241 (-) Transcript_14251:57-779(-)